MPKITDEMISLFARAKSIRESGDHDLWEHEGGRRLEFVNLELVLHRLCGLQLWDFPIFSDSADDDPVTGPIRRELEAAAAAQERAGRPLMRPVKDGLAESEAIEKRTGEALARRSSTRTGPTIGDEIIKETGRT
jgi:hypothetical protein